MTTVHVRVSTEYDVVIGRGNLSSTGEMILPLFSGRKLCLVTDSTVEKLYADRVTKSLADAGFDVCRFVFPAGEESKCMATYVALQEFLAEHRLSRKDGIVALGGGVTGDLAGFAAATYLRGIDFVQIPTTLLAAVDSSVGGKTGIDLAAGKNLCGAFHQPKVVICDIDTLTTLKYADYIGGMAEVIKYGVIRDAELFTLLEERADDVLVAYLGKDDGAMELLEHVIATCVGIKRDVVEADEFEGGLRAILNYGHTAAHAIENISGYRIPHGYAVGTGMMIATNYANLIGALPVKDGDRIREILNKYGLPGGARGAASMCLLDPDEFTPERMAEVALSDKKAGGGAINLVLPTRIGDCIVEKTPTDKLVEFMGIDD